MSDRQLQEARKEIAALQREVCWLKKDGEAAKAREEDLLWQIQNLENLIAELERQQREE